MKISIILSMIDKKNQNSTENKKSCIKNNNNNDNKSNCNIEFECSIDFTKNLFIYCNIIFSFVKVCGNIYFKGDDIANYLEYANPEESIKIIVENEEKITLEEIAELQSDPNLNLSSIDKKTIYITEFGLRDLAAFSNNQNAKKFRKFVSSVLIPASSKKDKYITQQSMVNTDKISFIPSFFDNNDITKFMNCNVVYIGIIGISENHILCKYGKTNDIKKRLSEHKKDFGENFILFYVGKTNNCNVVENLFRYFVKSKGFNRTIMFNGEKKTELFLLSKDFNLEMAKNTMQNFIQQNPTEEAKDLEILTKNNKQIFSMEESKVRQAEEKRKIMEAKVQYEREKKERVQSELKLLEEKKKNIAIPKLKEEEEEEENIFLQFLNEKTKETKDKADRIHTSDLYEIFKNWFIIKNHQYKKIPSSKEFCENLRKYKDLTKIWINEKTSLGIKFIKLK